jgi:hypothetical protein
MMIASFCSKMGRFQIITLLCHLVSNKQLIYFYECEVEELLVQIALSNQVQVKT